MQWMFLVLFLFLGAFPLYPKTITVPDDYPTIQMAIDAAQPGDTVFIREGTYKENLFIDRPLTLVGENRVLVRIENASLRATGDPVITVNIEQGEVKVEALTLKGGMPGIWLSLGPGAKAFLEDILVVGSDRGIMAEGSGTIYILDSLFVDNDVGLDINTKKAEIVRSEIYRGWVGILIKGNGTVRIEDCLVGLAAQAVQIYTAECGWSEETRKFAGRILGSRNRVFGIETDLCPSYPGESWPDGFIDTVWMDKIAVAIAALNRGFDLYNRQDYQGALSAFTIGLALLASAPFPLLEAYFYQVIGVVYAKLDRYEEALSRFEAARAVFLAHGMDVDVAIIDQNIGNAYAELGRYEEALSRYEAARAVYVAHEMEVDVAVIDQNIGNAYGELGRYEEALSRYEAARAVYAAHEMEVDMAGIDEGIGIVYGELGRYEEALSRYEAARAVYVAHGMDVKVARIDQNIGIVYRRLGRYEEALSRFEAARAVYVAHGMDVKVARIDQNIGIVYRRLGRYEEALSKFEAARAVFSAHGMEVDVAEIDQNTGVVYADLGRYEEALASYQEALAILDKTPPAAGMPYSYPATRWMIYANMGLANEGLGRWEAARESYEKSIAVIESLRGYMRAEELKSAWQERTQRVYERLIELLIKHGQGSNAFPYAERCRARTFLDLLARGPVGTIENVKEEGIRSGVVDAEAIEADVEEVLKTLPPDITVLEYFVTQKDTYLWVISQGEIKGPFALGLPREELLGMVLELRKKIEDYETTSPLRDLALLYEKLIRPVEHLLPETSGKGEVPHLIVIPSGPLYYLPFQALIWTSEDRSRHSYLIERYAISYAPSLVSLKYVWREGVGGCFLGLADPDLGDPKIPRLPEARKEAQAAAGLFGCHEVYIDREATEEVVQNRSQSASYLLFSTHGQFNPYNPLYSFLFLTPTGGEEDVDGRLHAYEVFKLDLSADLVVLSACETLLPSLKEAKEQVRTITRGESEELPAWLVEEITAGDEVVGLVRAFLSAGASSVLASLWSVASGPTAQLVPLMFEYMQQEGMDKVHALRAAQLALINSYVWSHPYYWAAFNLMGNWR